MTEIREERPCDVDWIRNVLLAAFPTSAEADLVDRIREEGLSVISLVAEEGGEVAGHILFSPVIVEGEDRKGLGLAPVAVAPQFQGRGIGSGLIEKGLEEARKNDFNFVVVLGDPAYYIRFGFQTATQFGLGNEYGAEAEFMAQELISGGLDRIQGMVRYAEPFASL